MFPVNSNLALKYAGLRVLHLFPHFHTLGGVESLLGAHRALDPTIGVQSDLIIYSDEQQKSEDRLHCLGLEFTERISTIGRRLRAVTQSRPDRVAIYHLLTYFRFLCPHDYARRRILVLHAKWPGMEPILRRNVQFVDGLLCVSPEIRRTVVAALPEFPQERIAEISYPIAPPDGVRESEGFGAPIRLGYIGRLQIHQKRIERLPEFCLALQERGFPFRFDVIGDGPNRHILEKSPAASTYTLHGVMRGTAYWEQLRKLDAFIFFSDFEGTPIAMLEALSQGVIPIYPRINTGGDTYVEQIDPELLYPPGDLNAAIRIVQYLSSRPTAEIERLRNRCREVVRAHSVANYFSGIFDFTQRISERPRISRSSAGLSVKLLQFLSPAQIGAIRNFQWTRAQDSNC
jgi:glycosyltransferase involved in cell wall biosynthesis